MEQKNVNNKGFSLVELIVVVLIMAIISVSLAPQVMKWVDNARIAADVNSYNSLIAQCQIALTDKDAFAELGSSNGYLITITSSGTTIAAKTGLDVDNMIAAMDELDSAWADIVVKATGVTKYEITIAKTGAIERTTPPSTAGTELE